MLSEIMHTSHSHLLSWVKWLENYFYSKCKLKWFEKRKAAIMADIEFILKKAKFSVHDMN